jgi:hypothetical protein
VVCRKKTLSAVAPRQGPGRQARSVKPRPVWTLKHSLATAGDSREKKAGAAQAHSAASSTALHLHVATGLGLRPENGFVIERGPCGQCPHPNPGEFRNYASSRLEAGGRHCIKGEGAATVKTVTDGAERARATARLFYGAIILSAQHRINGGFAKPLFNASRQGFARCRFRRLPGSWRE